MQRKLRLFTVYCLTSLLMFGAWSCADESPSTGKPNVTPDAGNLDVIEDVVSCQSDEELCGDTCVDTSTSAAHCGACGQACGAGELCAEGQCELDCAASESVCGGACVDTNTDPANCGACDASCGAGEVCDGSGVCAVSCQTGLEVCDGICTSTNANREHCGTCGNVCESGEVCSSGACELSCQAGLTDCNGSCTNTDADRGNCGGCGIACGAGEVCSAGACEVSCQAGLTDCGGSCVNADTDRANCGGCGVTCGAGEVCSEGGCELSCGGGLEECSGTCRDLDTDPNHCGGCGVACGAGEVCSQRSCEVSCGGGLSECEGVCRDLESDRNNCGSCGATCGAGEVCSNGTCELSCQDGLTDCGGSCTNTNADRANCGSCGTTCGAGEVCSAGSCVLSCHGNLVDCGGSCVQTAFDPDHCGGCDIACDVPTNAHASCSQSICGFICQSGWGNCDGLAEGCETNLASDRDHCGACGAQCPDRPNSSPLCTNGSCSFSCLSGFADCDNDPETGCLDLSADDQNCGGCGVVCGQNETCFESECVTLLGSGTPNDPYVSSPVEASCQAYLNAFPQLATDGYYRIDPPNVSPLTVYCNMTTNGGGWTACVSFENTTNEDLHCTNDAGWFDQCVEFTMANWTGNEVMVQLDGAYTAWGSRASTWTPSNLTSVNSSGSQYDRVSQHSNHIVLNNGHLLSISGFNASNSGWGGSWGNGYGVTVQTQSGYACHKVVAAMSYRNSGASFCNNRSFQGYTPSHEVMYSANGGICTHSNASLTPQQAFLGTFRFLVR